jgi:2,4-dienoyl-CoA reductase-like NADH-dependent reductase (Old Yellow Enzyme family)
MTSSISKLFSPFKLGPITLRNRSIRSAAFEGICPGNLPSEDLLNYHHSVAAGGIGMTTVAYAAVDRSALSFPHQLLLDEKAVAGLRKITDAVHHEGAACSIQIGHCGNMAKRSVAGSRPIAPSARLNLYGPTFPRRMNDTDIQDVVKDFGKAVHLATEAGFDAVEVHAGHGYLISQFLSPYTNKRRDSFGGTLGNRARLMLMVMDEVKKTAGNNLAVLVKINMRDGFRGGMETKECIETAKMLEESGADALVLSGGFVSKAPMYVMHGAMPLKVFAHYIKNPLMKCFVGLAGKFLVKEVPFSEAYFLDDAMLFRSNLKIPLVYVGGLLSLEKINEALDRGFELVAFARALIKDPDFINKLRDNEITRSECDAGNYCIAVMYSGRTSCILNEKNPDPRILKML